MSMSTEDESLVEVTYTTGEDGQMLPLGAPSIDSGCSRTCRCDDRCLDIVTGIVIFINVVIMGVELDLPWDGFSYLEQGMLCVYILDVFLRVRWHGIRSYASDKSHVLDIVIVTASICEVWVLPATVSIEDSIAGRTRSRKRGNILANLTMTLRSFRLVRAFRLLKLLKFAKPLYMILQSMMSSFKRVCWVMALLCAFLYAFSLVFTQLLGRDMMDTLNHEDPQLSKLRDHFSTVPRTFFELFRLMCGDVTDFGMLMSAENNIVVPLTYMVFQVSTPWLILSIFTAEVVDTTITTSNNLDREEIALKALHSRTIQRDQLTVALYTLFEDLDNGQAGAYVELGALATFLEDEEKLSKLNDITGLSAFQAINAWEAMENNGKVGVDDYIDGLVMAAHHSPEHSVLRMEAQMRRMIRNQLLMLKAVGLVETSCSKKEEESGVQQKRDIDGNGAAAKIDAALTVRAEEPEVEPDLHREIAQLQRSLQSVQAGLENLLHDRAFSQEAENNAATEIRKMHCDLNGMSSHFHNIEGLRSELQQLRNEIVQPSYTNDVKHMMQRTVGGINPCDLQDVRAGLLNVEGEITSLRSEIVSLVRTFRTDQLSSIKRGLSMHDRDPKQRLDIFADLRTSEASSRDLSSRLGHFSSTPAVSRSVDWDSMSPLPRIGRKTFFHTEPTFAERRGLSTTRQALPFQDARQAPLLKSLRERIGDHSGI